MPPRSGKDTVGANTLLGLKLAIGPGGQLIVGGFDPARAADAEKTAKQLDAAMPGLKSLGVTSHELYIRWNLCELQPGKFDWSVYDRFAEVYRKHGMKWVPFLICGSAYSLPDWYYKKPGSQGYVCLEHGKESDVQSLWNPRLRERVARFIKAFCDHYRETGLIESILLGVSGNYGECIYPVSGNDWTADIHGPYHSHPGFWAGDKYAQESFRVWLMNHYSGNDRLRDAWGPTMRGVDYIKPFLKKDAPNERAWLDMVDWYIDSMTDYSRFWLRETRKNFPKGDIYLCTGGHAPAEHGSDFAKQCRAAAEFHAGVRITNEASDYRLNFSLTHWVASAARQYGAYFSFEPAGGVDAKGVVARVYNATASGAKGLHYYYGNLFDSPEAQSNATRWLPEFQQRKPVTEIAAYYPETHIKLNGNDFLPFVQPLRDRFDFGFLSDSQIADGGLKHVKALVLLQGNIAESRTWQEVNEWVKKGGLLLYPEGMGRLRTVDGSDAPYELLFGRSAKTGKGRALSFNGLGKSAEYREFVTRTLKIAPELSAETRAMIVADGKEDNAFVTVHHTSAGSKLLWLNSNSAPVPTSRGSLATVSISEHSLNPL